MGIVLVSPYTVANEEKINFLHLTLPSPQIAQCFREHYYQNMLMVPIKNHQPLSSLQNGLLH
jgi:hypothetical protein